MLTDCPLLHELMAAAAPNDRIFLFFNSNRFTYIFNFILNSRSTLTPHFSRGPCKLRSIKHKYESKWTHPSENVLGGGAAGGSWMQTGGGKQRWIRWQLLEPRKGFIPNRGSDIWWHTDLKAGVQDELHHPVWVKGGLNLIINLMLQKVYPPV